MGETVYAERYVQSYCESGNEAQHEAVNQSFIPVVNRDPDR